MSSTKKTTKAVREAAAASEWLTKAVKGLKDEGLSGFQIEELLEKTLADAWEESKNA